MPDDVYGRYMQAARDWSEHRAACLTCPAEGPCPPGDLCQAGARLLERLARLQDAYLTHLKSRR